MHEVLVNLLGGLSLPRKSVLRLPDLPNMTLDVYRGRKTTAQQQQQHLQGCQGQGKCMENEIFPGQGQVREFCGWPGKFRKDFESQKNQEIGKLMAMAGSLQKIYSIQEGKGCTSSEIV